jgi:lysophospholipase L1-like esterase
VALPMRCFVRDGDDFSKVARPFALEGTGAGQVAVANIRFLKAGRPNAACPDYRTVSVTPDKLNESWAIDWWTPRHEKKVRDARALGAKAQVVFIGDSITEGWENAGAPVWARNYKGLDGLVLGFGGDRTENVLWRLVHGEVDGIAPKVAVLMFGTNNTGHRQEDPATTAAGIKRNIDELRRRLPDTKILLLAIFPRGEKADDPLRVINQKVNAIIAGFADNQNVFFLDIGKEFLMADGTLSTDIMPDLLHPNEKGYEIWARAMAPQLNRLLPASVPPGAPSL